MHPSTHQLLKLNIISLAADAKNTRNFERKALDNAREFRFLGIQRLENPPEKEYRQSAEEISAINYDLYQNLRHRRVHELRKKARNNLLAYGFLRGLNYSDMEIKTHDKISIKHWDDIERIVFNFIHESADPRDIKQKFEQWVQDARKVD